MPSTTNESHAVGKSIVPEIIQKKAPLTVERVLPNIIHDTGRASHAHNTGPIDSKVPRGVQDVAPEWLEKALPEVIHDTRGSLAEFKE